LALERGGLGRSDTRGAG